MCTVSMIGDHFRDRWTPWPNVYPTIPPPTTDPPSLIINQQGVSKADFDALKKDVEEMKALLLRAKQYDEENGEPDCEMDEKVALLKRVAEMVGVDLGDVFPA